MAKNPETKFKEEVLEALWHIPYCWAFKTQEIGRRGIPDIIGCVNGTMFGLELKTITGRASALQKHTITKIQAAGGYAAVVDPENWTKVYGHLLRLSGKSLKQHDIPRISKI